MKNIVTALLKKVILGVLLLCPSILHAAEPWQGAIIAKTVIRSSPITIKSNADFTPANGVVAGDGTAPNPFVISGLTIKASTPRPIFIQGTTSHFILKNIRIQAGLKQYRPKHGVLIYKVGNGRIENIEISATSHAAIKIIKGKNITILSSRIFNAESGILVRGGKKITISGNEIAYVQNRGINLDSGLHDIVISQNHVHHTATPSVGGEGIEVWGSKKDGGNILIKGNRVYECAEDGIELVGVKNAQIIDNISHDNQGQGIDLYGGSDNNLLFNNVVFGNHKSGILITDSSNNNLFDNKIYRNSPYGVRFEKRHSPKGSKHNKLHGDSPWNNKQDIETDSIDNIIVHTGKYSAKLPLSSKEQIFQLETKKFTQVRYYFQKWWMRVEAVTEAGKVYHSRRRLPPNIQFDLLPQNSFLDYELLSFAPSPAPKKFLLDLRLRALDKPTMTKLVIPQPSAHHAQYQLIINGKVTDLKSVKDNSLIFNFLVTAKTQQVQVQKTIQ